MLTHSPLTDVTTTAIESSSSHNEIQVCTKGITTEISSFQSDSALDDDWVQITVQSNDSNSDLETTFEAEAEPEPESIASVRKKVEMDAKATNDEEDAVLTNLVHQIVEECISLALETKTKNHSSLDSCTASSHASDGLTATNQNFIPVSLPPSVLDLNTTRRTRKLSEPTLLSALPASLSTAWRPRQTTSFPSSQSRFQGPFTVSRRNLCPETTASHNQSQSSGSESSSSDDDGMTPISSSSDDNVSSPPHSNSSPFTQRFSSAFSRHLQFIQEEHAQRGAWPLHSSCSDPEEAMSHFNQRSSWWQFKGDYRSPLPTQRTALKQRLTSSWSQSQWDALEKYHVDPW